MSNWATGRVLSTGEWYIHIFPAYTYIFFCLLHIHVVCNHLILMIIILSICIYILYIYLFLYTYCIYMFLYTYCIYIHILYIYIYIYIYIYTYCIHSGCHSTYRQHEGFWPWYHGFWMVFRPPRCCKFYQISCMSSIARLLSIKKRTTRNFIGS